jgi:hypothetical protein
MKLCMHDSVHYGINTESIRNHTPIKIVSTNTTALHLPLMLRRPVPESIATLPPFGSIEGHQWFFQISSQ